MKEFRMKKFNMILKEKLLKFVLSSGNIDRPLKQTVMIEYVKFTFEKQVKTIKQRIKQIKF